MRKRDDSQPLSAEEQAKWSAAPESVREQGQPQRPVGKSLLHLRPSPLVWEQQERGPSIRFWQRVYDGLVVLETLEWHREEEWLHVSASQLGRIPSWDEMRAVKEAFIGKDREAYVVLPPAERYVNDNPFVLHLWCPTAGPVLPDFRRRHPDGHLTL